MGEYSKSTAPTMSLKSDWCGTQIWKESGVAGSGPASWNVQRRNSGCECGCVYLEWGGSEGK